MEEGYPRCGADFYRFLVFSNGIIVYLRYTHNHSMSVILVFTPLCSLHGLSPFIRVAIHLVLGMFDLIWSFLLWHLCLTLSEARSHRASGLFTLVLVMLMFSMDSHFVESRLLDLPLKSRKFLFSFFLLFIFLSAIYEYLDCRVRTSRVKRGRLQKILKLVC